HYMYVLPYTDHLPLSLHDALPISASANMRFNAGLETRSFIPISHTMGGGKVIEGVLFSGQRLDKALAEASGLSRERVKALMAEGRVSVEEQAAAQASAKAVSGARFRIELPEAAPAAAAAQKIPLVIVFEDEHLIVVDKPAGMVVHPAAG